MTHHLDLQVLLPAFVLGTATDEEHALVEAHVAGCEACREETHRLEQLVAMLVDAAPQVDLPLQLRGQVLAAVRDMAPADAAAAHERAHAGATGSRAAAGTTSASPRTRSPRSLAVARWLREAARPRTIAAPALGLAAATLVVVAVLGDRALTNGDDAQPAKPRTVQVAAPATGVTNLEIASQTVPLATSSRMANATGDVALTSAGRGLIVLRAMPAPKPGRSWQAWTVSRDGTRRSARVVDSGGALVVLDIKVPAGTQAIAITDEPAGGSAQPSTAAAAYGSLT